MPSQDKFTFALTAIATVFVAFNLFLQFGLSAQIGGQGDEIAKLELAPAPAAGSGSGGTASLLGNLIPKGVPEIYGTELGVSFDDPVKGMDILKNYDPTYGSKKIALEGALLQRYIEVGSMIACEYCCGAKSLVFSDGSAACGCAHSQAMRGLAAYLLKNHAGEYTNDEILGELTKWKTMFFPKQMMQKAIALAQQSGITDIDPKLLNEIPDMVGGC